MILKRYRIHINGIVQGVGFRPFVFRLANECGLGGFVNNSSDGVLIEVEGAAETIKTFHNKLITETPPLASVVECTLEVVNLTGEKEFTIQTSERHERAVTLISPDISICEDCLKELFNPTDRRYRYPFINCTNCGPRYTIVKSIPYDRLYTSMDVFPLCDACSREYHDPANRRFHAQPNACSICGPKVNLCNCAGKKIDTADAIIDAIKLLREGKIIAIRGIGGFHLAVDAHNEAAVQELRRRKGRAEKPFAMMAPDIESIRKYCVLSSKEAEELLRPTRSIVLLRQLTNQDLASAVAPNNRYFGFMLPYTPLHYLILKDNFDALVMTSGNLSEEPIAIANDEALKRLSSLADYFLLHDRQILQRSDDSIVRVSAGEVRAIRRSRGYVPIPVFLSSPTKKRILACGGELKNTIALSRDKTVFLSQHIGDLDNPSAFEFFENSIAHLQKILEITPEVLVHDLHPEYLSTKWALQQKELPKIAVQHHHAHLVSVMAENGVEEPTIGIILDGTGYGTDGTIWGGEILVGDAKSFERFAWLEPMALPGGTAAIRQPWRMALSYLNQAFGNSLSRIEIPFMQNLQTQQVSIILQMIEKKLNAPLTSSCGRLFDAVSALLNIRQEINFEAQAAIELEMAVAGDMFNDYYEEALASDNLRGVIPVVPLICAIVEDIQNGVKKSKIAARFHRTLAELFLRAAKSASDVHSLKRIGLSGGVFQNDYFFSYILKRLKELGFEVLTHKQVPTNDGGLALGQVVVANTAMKSGNFK